MERLLQERNEEGDVEGYIYGVAVLVFVERLLQVNDRTNNKYYSLLLQSLFLWNAFCKIKHLKKEIYKFMEVAVLVFVERLLQAEKDLALMYSDPVAVLVFVERLLQESKCYPH